jgi:hypothetical protein
MATIMAIPRLRLMLMMAAFLAGDSIAGESSQALAQATQRRTCPLVVPAKQAELQPLRLKPGQVPAKNARGCLSPADALYAPDGCPQRLCGGNAGVIQLPPLP